MATDNYNPATSKTAYFPAGETRIAKLWAREKTIHDWADAGIVEFFEGPGTNPTALTGYSTGKLWLQVASGVTDTVGTVRYYDTGDASDVSNWPELSRSAFATHIGLQGFSWRGDWSLSTVYALRDAVYNDGSSYICIQAHTAQSTNEPGTGVDWEDYWDAIALQGGPGPQGVQGPQGIQGPQGEVGPSGSGTGDLLAANNLSELTATSSTARSNIGAASQTSVTAVEGNVTTLQTNVSTLQTDVSALQTGKANTSHTHSASEITSGQLALARGGLGADVSAYSGTVRITAGAASALSTVSQAEAEEGTSTVVREWTSQRIAQAIAALASKNVYVGQLTEDLSSAAPAKHVELNGATITNGATLYPDLAAFYPWMVSGSDIVLPDFRGRFKRVRANGSTNDPDRASRTARVGGGTGDLPGTYQADQLRAHTHTYTYYGAGGNTTPKGDLGDSSLVTPNTGSFGGNETRPINVYIATWMRVLL